MAKSTVKSTYGHGFLSDCNTWYNGTTGTADSGDTTHTVDAERTEANDYWNGCFIKYLTGDNAGVEKQITDFVAATDTITHAAFPNNVDAGDIYEISSWGLTEDGNVTTLSVLYDDVFQLNVTQGGNQISYYSYPQEKGTDELNLSSTVYTKIFFRYKTSASSAKILLVFDGWVAGNSEAVNLAAGHGQIVLAQTNSTLWTTGSATITSGKTIDHIRLYGNGVSGFVYYDFALICEGVFTFPNTKYGLEFSPPPRYANIPIPSRITDITQNLGSENAMVTASCDLDRTKITPVIGPYTGDDWKRPQQVDNGSQTDYVKGEVFLDIAHNSYQEPFQWLKIGDKQFKVTLDSLHLPERSDEHILDVVFKEYSRNSKTNESYVERFGLNL